MTFTSIGYGGTVDYADWAVLTNHLGAQYSVFDAEDFAVTAGPGDREVRIAPGRAAGAGILDTSDAVESLVGAPVASGNRWDLIVLRRTWSAESGQSKTVPAIVAGGTSIGVPARAVGPGVVDDQPLALVRFAAGQTAVQEVEDLRVWHGDAGLVARSLYVRQYLTRVGTNITINEAFWYRRFNAQGLATWVKRQAMLSGTGAPADSLGADGDMYFQIL